MNDSAFYTATMAKVFADQGYFEKAVKIYRYLLENEPGRQDLIKALADVEQKLSVKHPKGIAHLVPLFEQWLDLLLRYNRLQKLKKLHRRLRASTRPNNLETGWSGNKNTALNLIKKSV